VLLIFLVPFLIVEPLLVVATVAIAMGYVVSGAIAWIGLKILAVGLIPAIFDLTQHRLMTMPWFARAYDKVMAFHHYADQIVAPYKEAAAEVLRQWRRRAAAATKRVPGLAHLAARLAARKRANGRPALPSNG
jgi:biopolymer transport protein ExbB/TolQ